LPIRINFRKLTGHTQHEKYNMTKHQYNEEELPSMSLGDHL
jgi:hypothetical protein